MPFFRKKRPTSLIHEPQNNTNGSSKAGSSTPTFCHSDPVTIPPLQNFISPSDKNAQSVVKGKARGTSNLDDVLLWGRDYFSAFLRSEGVDEILGIWERIGSIKNEHPLNGPIKSVAMEHSSSTLNNEILRLKYQIEKSAFTIDLTVLQCEENENNIYRWIFKAQELIHQTLQDDYLPRFLDSKFHIKCQVDFFTNNDAVTLHDILSNHSSLFYFMEYVDQECRKEVLEFWLGATNFADQFAVSNNTEFQNHNYNGVIDTKMAQSDAMVLYEKYISLQAPQLLGFRDEIRSDVERLICSQDEIAHCFDRAIDEAFLFLHVTCLDGFLKSSLFLAFLSDLINSLSPPSKTHKRSESTSTCSSSSASLTSPVAPNHSSSLHLPSKSKLSLGHVNSLGRYTVEADTDLDLLKHESGLTKTVKKFVNFDEKEKAKEELAWQVAAMIVNEVTSITMGTGDSNNVAQ